MDTVKISALVKKSIEKQLNERMADTQSLILIGYSGLSASDLSALRAKLNMNNAHLAVVKNSLSKRILKQKNLENLSNLVEGPTGIIFVKDEPVLASKLLVEFAKDHQSLALKAGFMKDRILTKVDLEALSKIPSKEILRAKAVYTLKAPLNKLAMTLGQVLRKPLLVIKAIADKKQNQNQ